MVNISAGVVHPLLRYISIFILLIILMPLDSNAQVGFRIDPPKDFTVQYNFDYDKSTGLGIGGSGILPMPMSFILRSTVVDTTTNYVVITEKAGNLDMKIPFVMEVDSFKVRTYEEIVDNLWYKSTINTVNRKLTQNKGSQGLNISIPVPISSRTFSRITGGNSVSLSVTGDVNISGSLVKNDYGLVQEVNRGSDYSFKLEQTQRFNITGKIGEKISVMVNQDSERDFDLQNNIRLMYTGDTDEIIKSIEAGNVSLALPGTQFITFSGVNKGLFGFKAVAQIGDLNLTTIASLERGQKSSVKLSGGSQAQKYIIKDYNYVEGQYFWLDEVYKRTTILGIDGTPEWGGAKY